MLILETGSGVAGANSYVTPAFVTAYLTERGRETENLWSTSSATQQNAACIAATDYIDTRWGSLFPGTREFRTAGVQAQAAVRFASNPSPGDDLTVGERTYAFVASLADFGTDEVLIGAGIADTIENLLAAVPVESADAGIAFSALQQPNRSVTAALRTGTVDEVLFTAINPGEAGNDIPFAETGSSLVLVAAAFAGGFDEGTQPLEFPRAGLYLSDGSRVTGVPRRLRQAAAEYAVRARGAALYRDPTVDDTGRTVVEKEERVGPLLERTRYEDGSVLSTLIKPYPAADRLLEPYLKAAGEAYR